MTMTIDAPTVNDAHKALNVARETLDDFRTRAASGDTKVTGDQLTKARAAVELAELRLAAAVSTAEVDRANQREADIEALRNDIAAFDTTIADGARAQYGAAVEALRFLADAVAQHEGDRERLVDRALALGLTADEVAIESLRPRTYDYASLALAEAKRAAGSMSIAAHPLSGDAVRASAHAAADAASDSRNLRTAQRDLDQAHASVKLLEAQAKTWASNGDTEAADRCLVEAAQQRADVARLTALIDRLRSQ